MPGTVFFERAFLAPLFGAALLASPCALAQLNSGSSQILSTNQTITPLAPRGARYLQLNPGLADNPLYTAGQAVSTAVSPDGRTLLVLTSGYNRWSYPDGPNAGKTNAGDSSEWVFVFDISTPAPVQKQAIAVPNSYSGIVFSPSGTEFYVPGGDDDNLHVFALAGGVWSERSPAIALGHLANADKSAGNYGGIGIETAPEAAGVAVSSDGKTLVVANFENDSISVLSKGDGGWSKTGELDLRPGVIDPATATGVPGGEFPFWVQIKGNDTAYVSSIRDREIDVVSLGGTPKLVARIKVTGQPNKSVLNPSQTRLFVAQDNSDSVAVIDTASNKVIAEIHVTAPAEAYPNAQRYRGANPNSVALSPDEKTLYVTNGGENAVAVVRLAEDVGRSAVVGLIPTGFYPNSLSTSADGKMLYVVNGKSATGPNPGNCHPLNAAQQTACYSANQYIWQLTKGGLQTLPTPKGDELATLTRKVIDNDHMVEPPLTIEQKATLAGLRAKIHHVIYIIKENRTYDQVLGDLAVGNGDPRLTQFPQAETPNFHAFASSFVDFDNFYCASDVSGDGWPWSTSARTTDTIEKEIPVNYGGRGLGDDAEGTNRNINVGIGDVKERAEANPLGGSDPNVLPGTADIAAPDGDDDDERGQGYLWNSALRAGLTLRNYGFFVDLGRYNLSAAQKKYEIPEERDPHGAGLQVAYSTSVVLTKYSDRYFRGFDNSFPDYFRFTEWKREFDEYEKKGKLPGLMLVRLMHDHFGNYSTAIDGVNTPELQIADNDYAVGLLVETIAHSRFKDDTLIFVIEDDAQDGGDHVDAHRSTAFIIGPYVKHGLVDSNRYNTVSMLRTIEDILGIKPLNLNDAHARPMVDAFDLKQAEWSYTATPSAYLAKTKLPIPAERFSKAALTEPPSPLHDSSWWAEQTKGMDFSVEDHLDTAKFNRILWTGTMGDAPYPAERTGEDLRVDRARLLEEFRRAGGTVSAGER